MSKGSRTRASSRSRSALVSRPRTFFRYFSDKREVLFAGSDELRAVLVEKILQAPDVGEPLQVVTGVLSEFDWESLGSRSSQRQRQAVIAANPELLERDLIKNHSIAVGFMDALRQRGVDADIARLAAHVGIQLFITAYVHWLEAGDKADLALMSENVMSLLASIVPTNAQPPSSRQKSARVPANQADPSPRRGRVPSRSRCGRNPHEGKPARAALDAARAA
jgi:AcrR family transcriptional regulator